MESEERPQRGARPRPPQPDEPRYDPSWRNEPDPLEGAPLRPRRSEPPPQDEPMFGERTGGGPARSDWTWRDLLSSVDSEEAATPPPRQAARREAEDPVAHLRRQIAEPRPSSLPIVETIEHAGLHLDDVFSPSGLERIAQRARSGTQARRRAVREAAPDAAQRLADHLASDPHANQEALLFLRNDGARIAELIGRGRASMNAEATRAFLLIDAAAG